MFEKAQKNIKRYIAPMIPDLSVNSSLGGLVYLHGRLNSKQVAYNQPSSMILSTADFGRAYLSEGWATQFMRDLIGRYTVIFLGYSANDPPIRYLLEGLRSSVSRSKFGLYTFDRGSQKDVEFKWRDRGITAIGYDGAGGDHTALWRTLEEWAVRSDNPETWRRSIVSLSLQNPVNLKPHERGQVTSLISTAVGAKEFADNKPSPPAEWICVFDKSIRFAKRWTDIHSQEPDVSPILLYGTDDDIIDQDSSTAIDFIEMLGTDRLRTRKRLAEMPHTHSDQLPTRLFHLQRWMANVFNQLPLVWWASRQTTLHHELLAQIRWQIDRENDQLSSVVQQAWRLILEEMSFSPDQLVDGNWFEFAARLKRDGWTPGVLRELDRSIQPYLETKPLLLSKPCPPDKPLDELTLYDIANFSVKFPTRHGERLDIPRERSPEVFKLVRRGLEKGAALFRETETIWWFKLTLHSEKKRGERYLGDTEKYIIWFVQLFDQLCKDFPDTASAEVDSWSKTDDYFFPKLRAYAWFKPDLVSIENVLRGFSAFSQKALWDTYNRREILYMLKSRWSDFSESQRNSVISRLDRGPDRSKNEDQGEYEKRRVTYSAMMIRWLLSNNCSIPDDTLKQLPNVTKVVPDWNEKWASTAAESWEGRAEWVKTDSNPGDLVKTNISEIIDTAKNNTKKPTGEFVEYQPFQGLVEQSPFRALSALAYESRHDRYPIHYWEKCLSKWPDETSCRLRWLLALRLSNLPQSVVVNLKHYIPDWIKNHLPPLAICDERQAQRVWDNILNAFIVTGPISTESSISTIGDDDVEKPKSRKTITHAINSPIGQLSETLITILNARKIKKNGLIPEEIKECIVNLLSLPGEGGDHAACIVAHQLNWLNYIDHGFVSKSIVPLFNFDHRLSEAAWNGYLFNTKLPTPDLFKELKKDFLKFIPRMNQKAWDDGVQERLSEFIVLGHWWGRNKHEYLNDLETRKALQSTNARGRQVAVSMLSTIVVQHNCWKSYGKKFLRNVWPKEALMQTSETAQSFVQFASEVPEHFPEIVQEIFDYLCKVDHVDSFIFTMKRGDESGTELAVRYPTDVISVLNRIIPENVQVSPYDLGSLVDLTVQSDPNLRQNKDWQRLRDISQR